MILTDDLRKILDIGIALTSENSYTKLLELILLEAMNVTNSDAGTLYLCEGDKLRFIVMENNSLQVHLGGNGEVIDLPDVELKEENVCAYCAIHKTSVNIADVNNCDEFDFSGPKRYDAITGYHTQSMLVIPLVSHEREVLGVIQLINAQDEFGTVTFYSSANEYIVYSLASQPSVSLANMLYIKEVKDLLYSMVAVFTTAIDEISPYNGNHTYNVAKYTLDFVEYMNMLYNKGTSNIFFDENQKEQLLLAAMLHDIGKLTVPLEVLNKPTKLNHRLEPLLYRLEMIRAWIKIDWLEGTISKEQWNQEDKEITEIKELINRANTAPFLTSDMMEQINKAGLKVYQKEGQENILYITQKEKEELLIEKGTLNKEERKLIENHVVTSIKMLEKIQFGKDYKNVANWAGGHHEYLDGSGYPKKLAGDEIPIEMRILVIIDIYEALTCNDRPYKKPMTKEETFHILKNMVKEGKLDGQLVSLMEDYFIHEAL